VADGGATYTVNIELATRQFSQDLRNLKNKIQNELGKSVKVATGGTGGGTVGREKARAIRERRQQEAEDRRKAYSRDKKNAQQARTGDLIKQVNRLESYGFKVASKRAKIEEAHELAKKRDFQTADVRIKQLEAEIQSENKILDTIIKQGLEKEKQAKQRVEQARKLENRQRKGPHGQRMYGPIDELGNPIYTGKGPKPPAIPKSGASLPIDLGRKGTGKFATKQTDLLRRRQTLETLLDTFKGVNTDEVRKFKTGIQTLITEYSKVSDLQTKMRPTGMGGKAMGGWGAWKDGKLVTKDKIGSAGTLSRQLEQLDNLTKREEFRGKQIRLRIRAEEEFLNKKHRIEKLLATFDKKGVATDTKRLQLEKAVTVQDKQQLDTLLRQLELENIGLKGVSGTGGRRGGRGSTFVGGPSSRLNVQNGYVMPGPRPTGRGGRMLQSAMISGGFPLLFGQNPLIAGFGAAGGAIGEGITPGGGFAGGIAATAALTTITTAVNAVSALGKAMGPFTQDTSALVAATGKANTFRAKEIELIKELEGDQAAFNAAMKDMTRIVGQEGVDALKKFGEDTQKLSQDWTVFMTKMSAGFARLINWSGLLKEGRKGAVNRARGDAYTGDEEMQRILGRYDKLSGRRRTGSTNAQLLELEEQIKKRILVVDEKNLKAQEAKEKSLKRQIEESKKIEALYKNIGGTIKNGIVDGINAALDGTKTLGEVAGNVFRKMSNALLDFGVSMALSNLPIPGAKKFFGFANGGRPPKGKPSIVGERGPELFVPDSAGTIIPNHEMGGANIVVNVDASGSSVEGDGGQAEELGSMLAAAVQAELVNQQRPGGLLAGTR